MKKNKDNLDCNFIKTEPVGDTISELKKLKIINTPNYSHLENLIYFFERKGVLIESPTILPLNILTHNDKEILNQYKKTFKPGKCHVNSLGLLYLEDQVASTFDLCYGFVDYYYCLYSGTIYQGTMMHSFLVSKNSKNIIIDISLNIANLSRNNFERDSLIVYKNYFGVKFTIDQLQKIFSIVIKETNHIIIPNISNVLKTKFFHTKESVDKLISLIN